MKVYHCACFLLLFVWAKKIQKVIQSDKEVLSHETQSTSETLSQ